MSRCESRGCEGVARFIFNWSSNSDTCSCDACSDNRTKRFCKWHAETAESNLTVMGNKFTRHPVCIMEVT